MAILKQSPKTQPLKLRFPTQMAGTSRCDVPARAAAGGTSVPGCVVLDHWFRRLTLRSAAGTAQCAIPAMLRNGWVALLALVLCLASGPARAQVSREYQLKAVFLYNFSRFTDWPPDAFADPGAPLVIGVLGKDPFGPFLEEAVRGETVNNRPLKIEHFRRVEDVKNTHILFIADSEARRLPQILARLRGRSILTVSDIDDFAQRGGMVRFVTVNNKIQLRINVDALKAARLTMSSKVLRAADIVSSEEK